MSHYIETENSTHSTGVSAKLTEHPYFEAMREWCSEQGFVPEEHTTFWNNQILMQFVFEDEEKNVFDVFFKLYEVEEIYFWIAVSAGKVEPKQLDKLVGELNCLSECARTLYRVGLDSNNRVLASLRGPASVLNLYTFKKLIADPVEKAVMLRQVLVYEGFSVVNKGE